MNSAFIKGLSRGLFLCFIILLGFIFYYLYYSNYSKNNNGSADIGGDFELIGKEGRIYNQDDFLGKPLLIFFGFASCPDICPYGLTIISEVLDDLEADINKFNSVFVTLDPERDDYAKITDFVNLFHSNIIGLSGSVEQIDNIAKNWRVYKKKVDFSGSELDYTIDHSAFIYLMNKNGKYHTHFSHNTDAADIIKEISKLL